MFKKKNSDFFKILPTSNSSIHPLVNERNFSLNHIFIEKNFKRFSFWERYDISFNMTSITDLHSSLDKNLFWLEDPNYVKIYIRLLFLCLSQCSLN